MAASPLPPPPTGQIPDALLDAIAAEAEADADRVAALLFDLGYAPSPGRPLHMDADFLRFLGAVLRLHSWEVAGVPVHRQHGFPSAAELLMNAARSLAEDGKHPDGRSLSGEVLSMFERHSAWDARKHLHAPVVLDVLNEDAAVDALAEFLWAKRRRK